MKERNKTDLIGKKFGKLTVIEFAGINKDRRTLWKCECEDKNIVVVSANSLKMGNTKSCGCLRKGVNKKHGLSHLKCYNSWADMMYRCYNKNSSAYHNYGGRGITVCDRWRDKEMGVLNFFEDMGEPQGDMTIDRINNDGNYEPSNCRWASPKEQSRNRRTNINLTFNGETHCILDWSKILNISRTTITRRKAKNLSTEQILKKTKEKIKITVNNIQYTIKEISNIVGEKQDTIRCRISHGWPIEKIMEKKVKKLINFNNKSLTLSGWSKELNITYKRLHYRLSRGWSIEKAFSK